MNRVASKERVAQLDSHSTKRSQADFRRRPKSPYYGGQVAPSPPLATSAKDAKAQREDGF
jgi:hypothetical protein